MNIFKLYAAALSLMIISFTNSLQAQIKWGARAGVNFTALNATNEQEIELETEYVTRFSIGISAEIPVISDFYVQPSLLYSGKGYKADAGSIGFSKGFNANVSYIELPLHILYKPKVGPGSLILGVGPYLAYGTGGKWKTDETVLIGDIMIDNTGDIKFKNDASTNDYGTYIYGKPWDYGTSAIIGYDLFNTYTFQLNAEWGMANLEPKWGSYKPKGERKNKGFGISVGYKF